MDYIIVINSSNRVDSVVTHKNMSGLNHTIAVPHAQSDLYINKFGGAWVTTIDSKVPPFLPAHRQWCMEHFTEYKYILLMDDDLQFLWRDKDLKLHKSSQPEVAMMVSEMLVHLMEVPLVGVGPRFGNNTVKAAYKEIGKCAACMGFNRDIYHRIQANFAPVPWLTNEDIHINLHFLNAGYKNRILYNYAFVEKSGAPGGCSTYRNSELLRKSAHWLVEHHPEVSLKAKESKNALWAPEEKGGRNFRTDITVQWKKAYKPKVRVKKNIF